MLERLFSYRSHSGSFYIKEKSLNSLVKKLGIRNRMHKTHCVEEFLRRREVHTCHLSFTKATITKRNSKAGIKSNSS